MEQKNQRLISLNSASDYLKMGWSLLPMKFISDKDGKMVKKPMVEWKQYQYRVPTMEEVTSWIDKGYFLGLITGKLSGVVVVDDDRVKHGLKEANLTSSVVARTKSGGKHYYYKYDRLVTNHTNAEIKVDIRGEGGYVVLPPFNEYEWVSPPTKENMDKLTPIPLEVEKKIVGERTEGKRVTLSDFDSIEPGERNDTLHRIACAIWNNDKLTESQKIDNIEVYNLRCKPPLSVNELQTIINSAKSFVENNPKSKKEAIFENIVPLTMSEAVTSNSIDRELAKDCPSTGLDSLDKMVKGFIPGHIYLMSGDTNVGKTSTACYFACAVASQGKKVLYVSLEPGTTVVEYIATIIHDKKFSELVDDDFKIIESLPIHIFTKTHVRTVEKLLEVLKSSERYDLAIIDHIGYFVKGKNGDTTQDQSNVMKVIAEIAKEQRMAVMAIAHLNKPAKGRKKDYIPTVDDISGSAAFKQDATDVWILYKDRLESDLTMTTFLNTGYLIVAKSKHSASGPIRVCFGNGKAGLKEFKTDPFYSQTKTFISKTEIEAEQVFIK